MTAVEWLQDKWGNCKEWKWEEIQQWFEQAKEMEKQQIVDAYKNGQMIAEQYYNEAHGSDEPVKNFWVDDVKYQELIRPASSQTEISDEPHSTITDKIDGMIFELSFDDKMKLWELIDELVAESQTEISDEEISKWADDYGFRVPYDGSNDFYDKEAIKHFLNGAKKYREQLKSR